MQFRELTDRYQLEKILRSTRFGTVLKATDTKTGRSVAVKQITVPSPPQAITVSKPDPARSRACRVAEPGAVVAVSCTSIPASSSTRAAASSFARRRRRPTPDDRL